MKRSVSLAAIPLFALVALVALSAMTATGCGPDDETFTLRIYNPGDTAWGDHSSDGFAQTENAYAIDKVRHHFCPADGGTSFDFAADGTDGADAGEVLIPAGHSYDLLLPPGCHDVRVHQINNVNRSYEQARVIGRYGETLTWRTFRVFFEDDLK